MSQADDDLADIAALTEADLYPDQTLPSAATMNAAQVTADRFLAIGIDPAFDLDEGGAICVSISGRNVKAFYGAMTVRADRYTYSIIREGKRVGSTKPIHEAFPSDLVDILTGASPC